MKTKMTETDKAIADAIREQREHNATEQQIADLLRQLRRMAETENEITDTKIRINFATPSRTHRAGFAS